MQKITIDKIVNMNNKLSNARKRMKFGLFVFWGSSVFWIIKTIFFLVYQGWHVEATILAEKFCDTLVSLGLVFGFLWVFYSMVDICTVVCDIGKFFEVESDAKDNDR